MTQQQLTPKQIESLASHFQERVIQITTQYENFIASTKIQYDEVIEKLQEQVRNLSDEMEKAKADRASQDTPTTKPTD